MIQELTHEQFKEFTNTYKDKSPYQTSNYGFTMRFEGYNVMYIGYSIDGKVVAATLLLVKNVDKYKYAYAPRGFLIDYNDVDLLEKFTKSIKSYLSKRGIVAIKLSPMILKEISNNKNEVLYTNESFKDNFTRFNKLRYHHLGFNNLFEAISPRFEAVIPLNIPYYDVFKNISKRYRTKIRSAEKAGIRIYKTGKENLHFIVDQLNGKYPKGIEYFNNIYDNFDKNAEIEFYYAKLDMSLYLKIMQTNYVNQEMITSKLNEQVLSMKNESKNAIIAQKIIEDRKLDDFHQKLTEAITLSSVNKDGIVLATMLIAKIDNKIYNLMDTHDERFKNMNAKHLLIWKIMEKYSKEGYTEFNLGAIASNKLENNPYKGLNEFKLNFGAHIFEYIGDLELSTSFKLYLFYKNSASVKTLLQNK